MILIVIALVFGGIGAMWASAKGLSPLLWGIVCALTGFIGLIILAFQKTVPSAGAASLVGRQPENRRWQALVELDAEIGAAAGKARAAGPEYEQLLAEKYLALNDKQYLSAALESVLELARQEQARPAQGIIAASEYKRGPDGTYRIVGGAYVGRTFSTFAEMEAALD